jgi:hypothetical protein
VAQFADDAEFAAAIAHVHCCLARLSARAPADDGGDSADGETADRGAVVPGPTQSKRTAADGSDRKTKRAALSA